MIRRFYPRLAVVFLTMLAAVGVETRSGGRATTPATRIAPTGRPSGLSRRLPLMFERNEGQVDPRVSFFSRGHGYSLFLAGDETVLSLRGADVRLRMVGGNRNPRVAGEQERSSRVNYFVGPARRPGVRTYGQVRERDVFPGVDAVYYGTREGFEFDFVVAPGVDPGVIALELTGATPRPGGDGSIALDTPAGEVRLKKPAIYQDDRGIRREIAGGYIIEGGRVRFAVSTYDQALPLVIDPYVTYVGGGSYDEIRGIAVDGDGAAYVTGISESATFPPVPNDQPLVTPTAFGAGPGAVAFVAKLAADGSDLQWLTFVGGGIVGNRDVGNAIAVDASHRAYVAGITAVASAFPVAAAALPGFQTSASVQSSFMFRLGSSGAVLEFATLIGDSTTEAYGIAVDGSAKAFVTGRTQHVCTDPIATKSDNPLGMGDACFQQFPVTKGAFQTANTNTSLYDAFVMKIDPGKPGTNSLTYSTLVGGTDNDNGDAIAVDANGIAYVTGETHDPFHNAGFPLKNPFQAVSGNGGVSDAFVTAVTPDGAALVYSSFLGGDNDENHTILSGGIAVDADSNAYVTGTTQSTDLAVKNAAQPAYGGNGFADAFVAKIGPAGTKEYLTYLGGSFNDYGYAIAVDPANGNAYVSGYTESPDFPKTPPPSAACPVPPKPANGADVYLARFNASGGLVAINFVGGTNQDYGYAVAVDAAENAYLAGITTSTDFPTTPGAFQAKPGHTPGNDGFVAMIPTADCARDLMVRKSADHNPVLLGDTLKYTIDVKNKGKTVAHNVLVTDTLQVPPANPSVTFKSWSASKPGAACFPPNAFPPGVVTCQLGDMNPGEVVVVTLEVTVNDVPLQANNQLKNTAAVDSQDPQKEATPDDNHATVFNQIFKTLADLDVVKTGPSQAYAGEKLTYTITVTNHGPSAATGVSVMDTLPTGVTFDSASPAAACNPPNGNQILCQRAKVDAAPLAKNAQWVVTITAVPHADVETDVTNSVQAGGGDPDLDPANNTATWTTTVHPSADLQVTKQSPAGPIDAGTHFTSIVTVKNNGPSTATGVVVTDIVPANTTYQGYEAGTTLACDPGPINNPNVPAKKAGEVIHCSPANANLALTPMDPPRTAVLAFVPGDSLLVTNVATVTGNQHDPKPENDSATSTTIVKPVANLEITKTSQGTLAHIFEKIPYTVTVINHGPSTVASFIVKDKLLGGAVEFLPIAPNGPNPSNCVSQPDVQPQLICTLGPLAPNQQTEMTIWATPDLLAAGNQFLNVATVTAAEDPLSPKQAAVVTAVAPAADVAIAKVALVNGQAAQTVPLNGTLTYQITVTNQGPSAAANLSVQDQLPPETAFAVTNTPAECSLDAGNAVSCAIPLLNAGGVKVFPITGIAKKTGTITNTVAVFLETFDYNTSNNTATVSTGVGANKPKYSGSASASYKGHGGQPAAFTLPAALAAESDDAAGTAISFAVATDDGTPATCTPASGSTFPIGTTTVTCSAADRTGNATSDSFTVAVRDARPPALFVPGAPLPQHEWAFGPDPTPFAPGAISLSRLAAWDSGFASSPVIGTIHSAVGFDTRAVCSAGDPSGGRAGVVTFDGSNDSFIDLGAAGQFGTADFAISLWVRGPDPTPFNPAGHAQLLLSSRSSRPGGFLELRRTAAGTVAFELNDGADGGLIAEGGLIPPDGGWHFVVAQRHGAQVSVFVDGVLGGSANGPGPSPFNIANGNPLLLGGPGGGVAAAIDPLRIYTDVLSDEQIQRAFASGAGDGTCGATEAVLRAVATSDEGAIVNFHGTLAVSDAVDPDPAVECKAGGTIVRSGDTFPLGDTLVTCTAADSAGNATRTSFTILVSSPPTPVIDIDFVKVTEGDTSTNDAVFTVTLSHASMLPVSVDYSTEDGTATSGSDYVAAAGTVQFAPGETSKTITVLVNGDLTHEPDELFSVKLTNPTNAALPFFPSVSGEILDDDPPPPFIDINFVKVTEGDAGTTDAVFTVTLSGASKLPVSVHYATSDNTATAGSDYIAAAGTVQFLPGDTSKTITVLVNGDLTYEPDESFIVTLTSPVNAILPILNSVSGQIVNDDRPVTITPPVITDTPSNMSSEATSAGGRIVTYLNPTAVDAGGAPVPVNCAPASRTTFPLGTTTVSCSASDAAGNTARTSFAVTIIDTTPPAVSVPANITTDATSLTGAIVSFNASAADLVDGAPRVTCFPASGSTFGVGTTGVECLSVDAHDNLGRAGFTVTVLSPQQITTALIAQVVADGFQQARNLLQNALKSLNANNAGAACNQLDAFLNQVRAQAGKALTRDEAASLTQSANDAKGAIGCRPTVNVPGDVRTIQAAINLVPDGGIVRIAAGVYQESLTITGKRVDLVGAGRSTTIVRLPAPAYDVTTQRIVDERSPLQLLVNHGVVNYGRGGGGAIDSLTIEGGDIGVAGEIGGTGLPAPVAIQNVSVAGSGIGMAGTFDKLTVASMSILNSKVYGALICSALLDATSMAGDVNHGLVIGGSGSVGLVVYSCYPPGVASASLVNAHIDNNAGGGALFNGNMGLSIMNSSFDHNGTFGIFLAKVSLGFITNATVAHTSAGAFHLWNKAQGVIETYEGIADGIIAFHSKAFVFNSQSTDAGRCGMTFDSSGGVISGVIAKGVHFGLVTQGQPKADWSNQSNIFAGGQQAILDDGLLPVPGPPPIPQ